MVKGDTSWSDRLKRLLTTYWSKFELISLKNQTQNFNRIAGCAAPSRLQSTWGECTVSIALVTVDHHNMMGNAAMARTRSILQEQASDSTLTTWKVDDWVRSKFQSTQNFGVNQLPINQPPLTTWHLTQPNRSLNVPTHQGITLTHDDRSGRLVNQSSRLKVVWHENGGSPQVRTCEQKI